MGDGTLEGKKNCGSPFLVTKILSINLEKITLKDRWVGIYCSIYNGIKIIESTSRRNDFIGCLRKSCKVRSCIGVPERGVICNLFTIK